MKVTFRTIDGTHYLCADRNKGGLVVADRTAAQSWEEFELVPGADPGTWGLLASNGKWVAAEQDGRLVARTERPADWVPEAWEKFLVLRHPDGQVSFKTDHGFWVCAESGGGREVVGDRPAAGPWETFRPSRDFVAPGPGPGPGPDPLSGRVAVEGRFWVTSAGPFRPRFVSGLSLLRRDHSQRTQFLDWAAGTGFNGLRVFAGGLTWANQSPQRALDILPELLTEARARNLYVEVTALTDTGNRGYFPDTGSITGHARKVAEICARFDHCLFELANEPWHPTQAESVRDFNNLLALSRQISPGCATALGAPPTDEPLVGGGPDPAVPSAHYLTIHLDRSRDKWNMVRRVKELWGVSGAYGKPVMNNEPIGADEAESPGRRLNDPCVFLCMGALDRLLEVGGIHHSQAGLDGVLPGPVQQACADHYLRGVRSIRSGGVRPVFYNTRWVNSPIADANFDNVIRVYSGVWGDRGAAVLVGLRGNPELTMGAGWRLGEVIEDVSGCRVQELVR